MINSCLLSWTFETINSESNTFKSPFDLLKRIGELQALPPLPGIAVRIMQLFSDPKADADKLAAIIELDPVLTAQIIRWSNSSLYAYPVIITSVRDAINRVLGFDFVFNLALGLSAMTPLKSYKDGPIGTRLFWIHAMASTRLMSLLNEHIPVAKRFNNSELFLCGLLHNIGYPLLSDQFPMEFGYLSKLILANPTLPIIELERFTLGVDHNMLGAWLMNAWAMPKPIIDVVCNHHNPGYGGENYQLNSFTYLNDCLLGYLGMGTGQWQTYSNELLANLNLPVTAIDPSLEKLSGMMADITLIADSVIG